MNIYYSQKTVLFPPTGGMPVAPTPTNVLDYALKAGCYNLMLVPSFLKIWSSQPENVEKLAKFPVVVSGYSVTLNL
jgi:hypothetical protein